MQLPPTIQNLINSFNKLPGIGPKTSERFVFYLLRRPKEEVEELKKNLAALHASTTICNQCHNFSETSVCSICANEDRDKNLLCIVAEPQDLLAMEKTGFKGVYHVLGGVLKPIRGITPDKLNIQTLIDRIRRDLPNEVILALNHDLEGESTSLYLTRALKPMNVRVTRLARGLPMGSDLDYADEITLTDALQGRREL